MTSEKPSREQSTRRRFVATVGALSASALAGCGFFGQGGGSEVTPTETATKSPTPVTTTRQPSPTPTTKPSPTPTTTPNPPEATVRESNQIQVEIRPASKAGKQPDTTSLGGQQSEQHEGMACSTEERESTVDGGGLLTENAILNHRLNEIWPGAIIPAESVATGGFGPALSASRLPNRSPSDIRNPITLGLYIDANRYESSDANVSEVIDPPTSGNVEEARVNLLNNVQEGTSVARVDFDIEEVHSSNQLDLHFGLDYNNVALNIEGEFDYSQSTTRNTMLVKFYQVYYLMGVTFPNPHGSFITDPSVINRNDLLISDVAFGRLLLFSAESQHAVQDMRASLNAAFSSATEETGGGLEGEKKRVFQETKLKGQAIGGGASSSLQVISDFDEDQSSRLQSYLQDGADYGPENPAAPIGFTARYLSTQDRANTYLSTEYTARNCYPTPREFTIDNVRLIAESTGDEEELQVYGDISIFPVHSEAELVEVPEPVWSRSQSQYETVTEDSEQQLNIHESVTFEIPEDQTWKEYMSNAGIMFRADLNERDDGWIDNEAEWEDTTKTETWEVTVPVERTPSLVFSEYGEKLTLKFDISAQ